MTRISFNINNFIAGVLSGLVIVIVATAFTALVFKDSLSVYFSIGISCVLIGSLIVNLINSQFSIIPFSIARAEPAVGVILGIIFANLARIDLATPSLLPTLLVTILIVTLLVGVTMFLLGFFKLGQIVRFLPYPV